MKIYENKVALEHVHREGVIAIGNFDGVHLGHQSMLEQARNIAGEQSMPFGILTFEPHPKDFFKLLSKTDRICNKSFKLERLSQFLSPDFVSVLDFNETISTLSPQAFCEEVLTQWLHAKHIVVGENFRFGHKRIGDIDAMKKCGFDVTSISLKTQGDGIISATRIRELIKKGDIASANSLLGWDYNIASCGKTR